MLQYNLTLALSVTHLIVMLGTGLTLHYRDTLSLGELLWIVTALLAFVYWVAREVTKAFTYYLDKRWDDGNR